MSDKNIECFQNLLAASNWNSVTDSIDIELAFSSFFNIIDDCFIQAFPLRKKTINKQAFPWMTQGLLVSHRIKKSYFVKKIKIPL